MTSNETRAEILVRALRAGIDRDRATLEAVLTDDVRIWTPAISTTSRRELLAALERRDDGFSDIELIVTPLDVGGDYACVEWTADMAHGSAPMETDGVRVTVHGATVAEFEGERICSMRQYWDEFTLVEQLGDG